MKNKNISFDHKNRFKNTKYSSEIILNIVDSFSKITSAVDVGGGVGVWLNTLQEKNNLDDSCIQLIDGDYIDSSLLAIDEKCFVKHDLEKPIEIKRRFDLAISLEVAEHLGKERARSFCEDLTKLSDVVLFGAAIPGQGGQNHINEQPIEYWIEIFDNLGYEAFDIIRPQIQYITEIPFWYRQNMLIYVKRDSLKYIHFSDLPKMPPLSFVAYDLYNSRTKKLYSMPLVRIYNFIFRGIK